MNFYIFSVFLKRIRFRVKTEIRLGFSVYRTALAASFKYNKKYSPILEFCNVLHFFSPTRSPLLVPPPKNGGGTTCAATQRQSLSSQRPTSESSHPWGRTGGPSMCTFSITHLGASPCTVQRTGSWLRHLLCGHVQLLYNSLGQAR